MTRVTVCKVQMLIVVIALSIVGLGCSDDSTTTPVNSEVPFVVNDQQTIDASQFSRVDRMAMPAIGTVVITSKDSYNQASPADDAAGNFVGEITSNIAALHQALDDDLAGLGLTPCVTGDCVAQAAPLVVPDVIKIDITQAAGFPNGRRLVDPVIDITLALILLDLNQHAVTTLLGVNPSGNDRSFLPTFPYVALPHEGLVR